MVKNVTKIIKILIIKRNTQFRISEKALLSRELPNISFHYIRAHTNANDKHSEGNAKADELANLSIFV